MINGHAIYRCDGFNLRAAPGTLFTLVDPAFAAFAAQRFIPLNCFAHLRTMSGGALATAPAFRIGTNASHNDLCPIFSPPLGVNVGVIGAVPFTSPLVSPSTDVAVILELTTAAVGPTVMTADVLIYGLIVG